MRSEPPSAASDLPLPVAELHLHLDDLRGKYAFTDLQSFLDLYYANMAVRGVWAGLRRAETSST